jgi:hypothetical protein
LDVRKTSADLSQLKKLRLKYRTRMEQLRAIISTGTVLDQSPQLNTWGQTNLSEQHLQ